MTVEIKDALKQNTSSDGGGDVAKEVVDGNVRLSTIVALQAQFSITTHETVAALRKIGAGFPLAIDTAGADDLPPTLLIVNGIQFAILNMDAPVPGGNFGSASSPNVFWPTAPQDISKHRAHIMVFPETGKIRSRLDLKACATLLTLVSAAIASITPAIGVWWSNSDNLLRASMFMEAVRAMSAEERSPVEIWARLFLTPDPANSTATQALICVTRGLRPFIGRELEFAPGAMPTDRLILKTLRTSTYLIDSNAIIKEGETIGALDDPKYPVHLLQNGLLRDGPVYRIAEPVAANH